jgi:acyl-CoA thioester hydrolase
MFKSETSIRVRYSETDQMGIVYYGNYAQYYEVARVESLRAIGISYADIENEMNVFMPVMAMDIKYIRPARYDESINIVTEIPNMPNEVIRFKSYLYNGQGELLNVATVKLCFVDKQTNKRINTPDLIIDRLKPYFEKTK